ncbi:MAG TPA: branched-chain amino acid transport system II carrier protein, partial [Flavobacterium sp.]|nr:branched-chain amino acid transport system II carrier protein [Flavobacterium sp.]
LGDYGTMVISLAIGLACLTTSIALTTSFAEFFRDLFKQKISYRFLVTICTLVSGFLAVFGVDSIIGYAGAILNFVYPVVLVMIVYMLIFGRRVTSKTPYLTTVLVTILISMLNLFINLNIIPDVLASFPFRSYNIEWILPSILGFGIGFFLVKNK